MPALSWAPNLGHTGFYTKADYKEIVRYAGENGMVVVPEIDMPGHTTAALHAIPQLNSAGSAPKPLAGQTTAPHQGSGNVGESSFDADNAATYEFTKEVLTQIAAMTPGPYLHIGGDESHVHSRRQVQENDRGFAGQVKDLNKQVIGWNEYSSATLPAGAVVQFWAGNRQGVADRIIANDPKVILSPAEKTYIPQKQDGQPDRRRHLGLRRWRLHPAKPLRLGSRDVPARRGRRQGPRR